ncbi:MAG: protein-disulfide isomerase [Erythrobacter sp.]|nr:protein-disulfide isomerase [Erythrobacter sp.]
MRPFSRRLISTSIAVALTLGLAACNSAEDTGEVPEVDRIAPIAAPAGKPWADVVTATPEGGFVIGNPAAPIKLLEYASHSCSHCAEFAEKASAPLRDNYVASGRVSYEIRNQIHDPIDLTFAVLARCAGPEAFHPLAEQGWANLASIFEAVERNSAIYGAAQQQQGAARMDSIAQAAELYDFFAARGLSSDQARQCLADQAKAEDIVKKSAAQSDELGVTGTPTFFINGRNVGTQTWSTLEPMLQRAGAR